MTTHAAAERSPEQLFGENIKLVQWAVNKYRVPESATHMDRDDMFQEAWAGLWDACRRYDIRKGYTFSTLAVPTIRSQLNKLIRNQSTQKRSGRPDSLNFVVRDVDGRKIEVINVLPSVPQDWTSVHVDEFLASLNPRRRYVLLMRMQGYSQTEIAQSIGIKQSSVQKMLQRIGIEYVKHYM